MLTSFSLTYKSWIFLNKFTLSLNAKMLTKMLFTVEILTMKSIKKF